MCNPSALISGGASIISGIAGRSAAKKKSKAEAKATQENYARQQAAIAQFNANDPYATLGGAGSENSSQIAALLGQNGQDPTEMLRSTPGYEFSFNEGMKAIEHSLGAKNALYSSKAMRDITRYGQGMADQLFQQTFNNRLSIADGASGSARVALGATTGASTDLASGQIAAASTRAGGTQSLIDGVNGVAGAIIDGIGGQERPATHNKPGMI